MSDATLPLRPVTLQDFLGGLPHQTLEDEKTASLVSRLLQEQRELTAVEQFSRDVAGIAALPEQARYYSRLLPTAAPLPGEQYAFEVDLDRCSGCKACVTACHALNGLDDTETWRDVGLLVGGTDVLPVMQHVTAACHHCLEPGCMAACPVNAYEKDSVTGIVRHLDDQCFGCQYCTLACPYNVPKYHHHKGIVRKCDMCSHRLANGEAPACVQACPHEAIAIRVVAVASVIQNAEVDDFLPAAPEPHLTLPTTTYKTARVFPRNMLPADYYSISPQHPHWPLIVMLVLTQLSVGTFATISILDEALPAHLSHVMRPFQASIALCLGLLALVASTLHLGRPHLAFRGLLGLRHSWLSREILAFGVYAGLAVPFAAVCWWRSMANPPESPLLQSLASMFPALRLGVVASGILGVFCSVMIYVFTKREFWSFDRTGIRFLLTMILTGLATTWLSLVLLAQWIDVHTAYQLTTSLTQPLGATVLAVSSLKLAYDVSLLRHLTNFRNTPLKRSALLVTGPLKKVALARVLCGVIGGIVLPLLLIQPADVDPFVPIPLATLLAVVGVWLGSLIGELLERYLFFAAVSAPMMPGGVRP